ncbi:MAG: SH3 domain-containing protein [Pirellulales bacterium]|nr:SH3 domain-containing protein [Pirellulales bacterium]
MRPALLMILPLCGLMAASALGGAFPYKAYVTADDVYVRSGPGQDYYPTDKLKAGQEVEVYRHDPGGWCAIRPPQGSFTWVSTRYVQPTGDGLARIAGADVAARVGSRFNDTRDSVQVRLHEGELVELLEPKGFDPNQKRWARIAPPSGEFRWVHRRFVDPDYPVDGVRKAPPEESPMLRHARRPSGSSDDWSGRGSSSIAASGTAFQQQLDAADLALSAMVAKNPNSWHFNALLNEAEALHEQAGTAVERGRARVLLAKIDRFADLKRRQDSVNSLLARSPRRLERTAQRPARPLSDPTDDRYDGTGRLTRVTSTKEGAPRYALVDQRGAVRYYVTPSPDLQLRHYEGRWIGVTGQRAYVYEQQTPHLTAMHVNPIDPPVLR